MKIISLMSAKGGCTKTTTSINLAVGLAKSGKVLLIDLDPQGNSTTGVGINKGETSASVYELLVDSAEVKDVIIKTKFKNLCVIPASINLAGADMELMEKTRQNPDFVAQLQLKNKISNLKEIFDYIILDCPPSLGLITMNALAASDSVIIPVQCEFFALEGITQLLNSIIMVQSSLNHNLRIEGVLLTMLDGRTNIGLEVIEEIRKYFKDKVFNTIIPRLVRLVEAPSHGKPINEYDPTSRATEAYANLAKEVINRNGE